MSTATAGRMEPGTISLQREVGALKDLVESLVREHRRANAPFVPAELHDLYRGLIESQVAEDIAADWVRRIRGRLTRDQLGDPHAVRGELASLVESLAPVVGPIQFVGTDQPTVIAFVGPTGVGKTTTVAKLAADFRLRRRRDVSLITIDTYRIAAVEQLATYARIIDVPLAVVTTPQEMASAIESMSGRDVVLIDTVGRSQNDGAKLGELRRFLDQARPHETHLLIPATVGDAAATRIMERYAVVGVNRVIFTKLDEAVGFGVIVNSLCKVGQVLAPALLSYVTTGQDVPDDIEPASGRRLAELITGGLVNAPGGAVLAAGEA